METLRLAFGFLTRRPQLGRVGSSKEDNSGLIYHSRVCTTHVLCRVSVQKNVHAYKKDHQYHPLNGEAKEEKGGSVSRQS